MQLEIGRESKLVAKAAAGFFRQIWHMVASRSQWFYNGRLQRCIDQAGVLDSFRNIIRLQRR